MTCHCTGVERCNVCVNTYGHLERPAAMFTIDSPGVALQRSALWSSIVVAALTGEGVRTTCDDDLHKIIDIADAMVKQFDTRFYTP